MATYTENYNLKKPTYAEPANVKDINDNMEKIDDVMHNTQISLADAYDQNETYNTGDIVMYEMLMYKCKEDNVTGAWNASKWERTTAGESGGGADLDIYGEASGTAEVSFSDGAEASLVECEIGIVPTQDLHGYSKPWAGGAGKNKAEGRYQWNINASGEILTRPEYATCVVAVEQGETYTFSIDGVATIIDVIAFYTSYPQIGSQSYDSARTTGVNAPFTAPITGYAVIRKDIDVGNMQVEKGSQATTFEPYSNICPISGHTDVTVTVASTSGGSGDDTTVSLGRTVYGGTLDVTTGELTVTKKYATFSDISSWTYDSARTRFQTGHITDMKTVAGSVVNDIITSCTQMYSNNQAWDGHIDGASWTSDDYFYVSLHDYTSVTDLLNAIGNEQIVYPLVTPQTFTLSKEQIQTLLGQNYVSHDGGGTISLVYIKKDSTIIPNPSDAEIPLTGIEIDGEKFKIVPETEDIAEMDWTLLDSTTSTGTSTLIPEGTKYLALVVDFSVSASIVAIESIKNIIKTMDITSKSVWNVGYEWCDTAGNHTYVAMSGDATHVQAYSGYNTVTAKVYAVS